MQDVAAVRGLNGQRDIFRELKLIIQRPVGGEECVCVFVGGGGPKNFLQSRKKALQTKGSFHTCLNEAT